jgi:hypothetical protein
MTVVDQVQRDLLVDLQIQVGWVKDVFRERNCKADLLPVCPAPPQAASNRPVTEFFGLGVNKYMILLRNFAVKSAVKALHFSPSLEKPYPFIYYSLRT